MSGCHSPERSVDQRLGPPGALPVKPGDAIRAFSFLVSAGLSCRDPYQITATNLREHLFGDTACVTYTKVYTKPGQQAAYSENVLHLLIRRNGIWRLQLSSPLPAPPRAKEDRRSSSTCNQSASASTSWGVTETVPRDYSRALFLASQGLSLG